MRRKYCVVFVRLVALSKREKTLRSLAGSIPYRQNKMYTHRLQFLNKANRKGHFKHKTYNPACRENKIYNTNVGAIVNTNFTQELFFNETML